MFTGIIETLGEIVEIRKSNPIKIVVRSKNISDQTTFGASIAINGVCLTVSEIANPLIYFDVTPETLRSSNLGELRTSEKVNLEQALQANGRFDGHIVQGHVDEVGKILSKTDTTTDILYKIQASQQFCSNIVKKGSVTIDGISLTIADVDFGNSNFSVALIPTTLKLTNLQHKNVGAKVNLEADILGKYVKQQLAQLFNNKTGISATNSENSSNSQGEITLNHLADLGF